MPNYFRMYFMFFNQLCDLFCLGTNVLVSTSSNKDLLQQRVQCFLLLDGVLIYLIYVSHNSSFQRLNILSQIVLSKVFLHFQHSWLASRKLTLRKGLTPDTIFDNHIASFFVFLFRMSPTELSILLLISSFCIETASTRVDVSLDTSTRLILILETATKIKIKEQVLLFALFSNDSC